MSLPLVAVLVAAHLAAPIPERDRDGKPHLQSESAVIRLADTGQVLVQKNPGFVRPIASVTKLLSGLVLSELAPDATQVVTIGEADKDRRKWSRSRLFVGLQAPWGQLAQAALSASDNRAMYAVSRVALPTGDFAELMNRRAHALGMTSSRFVDAAGVDPGNVSTAHDLLELVAAAASDDRVREWASAQTIDLATGKGSLQLVNPDRLVHLESWEVVIGKTGYTVEAGRTLVARVRIQGRPVDMVFLGSREWASVFGDAGRVRRWLEPQLVREAAAITGAPAGPAAARGEPAGVAAPARVAPTP